MRMGVFDPLTKHKIMNAIKCSKCSASSDFGSEPQTLSRHFYFEDDKIVTRVAGLINNDIVSIWKTSMKDKSLVCTNCAFVWFHKSFCFCALSIPRSKCNGSIGFHVRRIINKVTVFMPSIVQLPHIIAIIVQFTGN